jgi:hypothetical protein
MDNLREFDSDGRLIEGVAFGSLVRKAIESDGSRFFAEGAIEKFCAKTAVADSLHLSGAGQAVHVPAGASSAAKSAWIAGGAAAAVCAALLFLHPPAPEPEARDVVTTHIETISEDFEYIAEAEISFGDEAPPYDAVDPAAAEIRVLDSEGTATAWRITDADGDGVAYGDGATAAIPSLAAGRYAISWDVVGTSGAISVATREFTVS